MKRINNYSKKAQGMTFIEVLIALVIMVTGILGAVAMQATAKKGSFDAMQRSIASSLAQDIIEKMRSNDANPITAILPTYVGTYGGTDPGDPPVPACNTPGALCTSAQMVANDLYQWTQSLRGADTTADGQNVGGLINAIGCITESNNAVTITVSWQGRTRTQDGAANDANFATNTTCGTANDQRRQVHIQAFIF
ncbi:MAG: type IV pilus modification protein PilV [Colwellia sp.]|nr:type IV pilus modification protein PilV [Colwellia sp.]MCW9080096.1 type IV pilus modification protein PilV [Colwellia sp.]